MKKKFCIKKIIHKNKLNSFTIMLLISFLLLLNSIVSSHIISDAYLNNKEVNDLLPAKTFQNDCSNRLMSQPKREFGPLDTSILIQDFEDEIMPPHGWTQDINNVNYTWELDDSYPYEGNYHVSCFYDPSLNFHDEWLITPSLDFSGYNTGIYLSFWWMMSYYWGVSPYDNYDLNIKISTNGGTTWTLLWNEDTVGIFEDWTWYEADFGVPIDLSAYAEETHVMIGFQYEGLEGAQLSLDYIEIFASPAHDVGITGINSPTGVMNARGFTPNVTVGNFGANNEIDIPVNLKIEKKCIAGSNEDFETDNGSYNHSTGPEQGYNDDWEWGIPNYSEGPNSSHSEELCWGTNLAGDHSIYGDMVLDSIEINLSELSSNLSEYSPRLEFYHWYDLYYFRNGGNVKISCDKGNTWNIISPEGDYPENSIVFNNKGIPNEPAYSNVYTGGDPSGNGTEGWKLAVFDLSEYKNEAITLRWHCGSITSTFYNRAGWYIDDVKIAYDDVFEEYNKTILVNLSFRESVEVLFPEWNPTDWKVVNNKDIDYIVTACTRLFNDEDIKNDCRVGQLLLHFPFFNDVGTCSINNPVGILRAGVISPNVTVKNFGQINISQVPIKVEIDRIDYTYYFQEDFEYGLPTNWTVINGGNTDDTWTDTNPGERIPEGGCRGTFMIADSDYAGFEGVFMDEYLISPSFNCENTSQVLLRLSQYYNYLEDDVAQVDISNNGGISWISIANYTSDIFGPTVINISSIASGCSNVKLRFHYTDSGTWAWYWMVDDIQIYSAVFQNEYQYTEYVDISSREFREVTFPEWTPNDISQGNIEIDYEIRASTHLEDIGIIDEDIKNNNRSEIFTLQFVDNVGVESITQPAPPQRINTIFTESFEQNWTADSNGDLAPPGWENHITDFSDTGDPGYIPHYWGRYGIVNSYRPSAIPPDGSYQSIVQWSENHQDEWLVTPIIDLFDYDDCQLKFWRYGHTGSTHDDHYYVKVSPTAGYDKSDFTDIIWDASELPEGDNHYDTPYGLDLSDYDGLSIRIAWHNDDPPNNSGLWYGSCIDDIVVSGIVSGTYPTGIYPVEAIVKNHGTYYEDFNVNATIYKITEVWDELIYESNYSVTNLAVDAVESAVFDDWTVTELGKYRLEIKTELPGDNNPEDDVKMKIIRVDPNPPTTSITLDGIIGENNWYISDVIVTLEGTDDLSGVLATYYRVDGADWELYLSPFIVSLDGIHSVDYYSVDKARNREEEHSIILSIDKTLPTIILTSEKLVGRIIFTADVSDVTSGVDRVEFFVENETDFYTATQEPYDWVLMPIPNEEVMVTAIVYDQAGNLKQDAISVSRPYIKKQAEIVSVDNNLNCRSRGVI